MSKANLFKFKGGASNIHDKLENQREKKREEESEESTDYTNSSELSTEGSTERSTKDSTEDSKGSTESTNKSTKDLFTEYAAEDKPKSKPKPKTLSSISRSKFDEREDAVFELKNKMQPISTEIILDPKSYDLSNPDHIIHSGIPYPEFGKGFFHWIHSAKNKTDEAFAKFESKKKVYLVVSGYERYVDDYDQSIGKYSEEFFKVGKKHNTPNILSRAFYKLWEMICYYDLIDKDKTFKSAHLAEGPGSFIQAAMFYRDMFSKNSSKDSYYAITIHSETEEQSDYLDLETKFVSHYSKEKPIRLQIHKTYNKQVAGGSKTKDNGDLTKTKTIKLFAEETGLVDLVTGDGGFDWTNENIQEQECSILIFAQILTALNIQKKGGHFVLKMFEMFTTLSLKFLMILKYFYSNVYIIKPLMSRESNSERYVVCKNFKFDLSNSNSNSDSKEKKIVASLMNILDELDTKPIESQEYFLGDLFSNVQVPQDLIKQIISINTSIVCDQYKVINKMVEFIDGSNYYGDLYMWYKDRQITLSKYWIDRFFDNISKSKELIKTSQQIESRHLDDFAKDYVEFVREDKIESKTKAKPKKMARATAATAATAKKTKTTKPKTKTTK